MLVDIQPRILLVNRRRVVWRFWAPKSENRSRATQSGFARALGTSLMSVMRFEAEEQSPVDAAEYEAYLVTLEEEVEEERRRRGQS